MWLAAASAALAAGGCKDAPTQTVAELKRTFAAAATSTDAAGAPIAGLGSLTAGDVDRASLDLLDVRFETIDGRMLHASRAHVMVDVRADTVQLKLFDVTVAVPEREGEPGGFFSMPEMLTDPWPAGVDVVEQ